MKIIKGVEIEESQDLSFNIQKLRIVLNKRYSFWYSFNKGLKKIQYSNNGKKVNFLAKSIYFISLFPKYIYSISINPKVNLLIRDAEDELIQYYSLPETKIKTFRLQCKQEELKYQAEITIIAEKLKQHEENLKIDFIGENTKNEINSLMTEFKNKLEKKNSLLNFYIDCQKRLLSIEKQIEVRKLIESSKELIDEMVEGKDEFKKQTEMESEFKIFDYYGEILEELNTKFKNVEEHEDEKIAEFELKEIITQINRMNLD